MVKGLRCKLSPNEQYGLACWGWAFRIMAPLSGVRKKSPKEDYATFEVGARPYL